jgi:hypothetical protein
MSKLREPDSMYDLIDIVFDVGYTSRSRVKAQMLGTGHLIHGIELRACKSEWMN